jgi:hypothetical protein
MKCYTGLRVFRLISKTIKFKIYGTTTMGVVVHKPDAWFLTRSENTRLVPAANSVLRREFWVERKKVTGSLRKLSNV